MHLLSLHTHGIIGVDSQNSELCSRALNYLLLGHSGNRLRGNMLGMDIKLGSFRSDLGSHLRLDLPGYNNFDPLHPPLGSIAAATQHRRANLQVSWGPNKSGIA